MNIRVGTDILRLSRFLNSLTKGKENFTEHLFTPQGIRQNSKEQLAGIFCVKEALIKALGLPSDSWLKINTNRTENGKVKISFLDSNIARKVKSLDTSISHDGGWIITVAVVILES